MCVGVKGMNAETGRMFLEVSLLGNLLVGLDGVAGLEIDPVLERQTAFGALAHFHDVFLDVLEG